MCAINPKHKRRLVIDVYASQDNITKEEFDKLVVTKIVASEIELNTDARLRWHVKESDELPA